MDLDDEELEATRIVNGAAKESDTEEDIKILESMIEEYENCSIPEVDMQVNITFREKQANAINNILLKQKQDKEKIQELEAKLEFKKWGDLDNIQFEEYMNQFIPKQKVKDVLTEIQKEYEKLDKASDEFLNNIEKTVEDYVLEKERLAIMQTLAYCRDNLEELLEEK